MKGIDQDGNQKGSTRRKCEWKNENSQKRGNFTEKSKNLVVVDRERNTPTSINEVDENVADVVLSGGGNGDGKYVVDKDDFVTMNKAMSEWRPLSRRGKDHSKCRASRLITACDAVKEFLTTDEKSGSFKIVKLDLSPFTKVRAVPAVIGELTHLQELNLRQTNVSELPTNIFLGCKDLKILNLSWTTNLGTLPDEIGKLTELRELYLDHSIISKLPPDILLGCKQLKILSLSFTRRLTSLPNEIGSLSDLRELYLSNSSIVTLPDYCTLGKLQKLEVLDLGGTRMRDAENTHVDGEVQHGVPPRLSSLRRLSLRNSTVLKGTPSLPPRWERDSFLRFFMSKQLCDVDLYGVSDLVSLPDIVGDLTKLERLDLSFSSIASLPPAASSFYDGLVHLKVLNLTSTPFLRKYPERLRKMESINPHAEVVENDSRPLHGLVLKSRCPLLGCVGLRPYQTDAFQSLSKLRSVLARNRARSRISSMLRKTNRRGADFSDALWPMLLARATGLYGHYEECEDGGCDCRRPTDERDALFGLLVAFGNAILGGNGKRGNKEEASVGRCG